MMEPDPLPLFTLWERVVGEILDRTMRFPKSTRFTFSSRIESHALDVLEQIVEARYGQGAAKRSALRSIDGTLTKLRVLLRLANSRHYLDNRGYEHLMRQIDEAGRMVGGWRKQQADV